MVQCQSNSFHTGSSAGDHLGRAWLDSTLSECCHGGGVYVHLSQKKESNMRGVAFLMLTKFASFWRKEIILRNYQNILNYFERVWSEKSCVKLAASNKGWIDGGWCGTRCPPYILSTPNQQIVIHCFEGERCKRQQRIHGSKGPTWSLDNWNQTLDPRPPELDPSE